MNAPTRSSLSSEKVSTMIPKTMLKNMVSTMMKKVKSKKNLPLAILALSVSKSYSVIETEKIPQYKSGN